MGQFDSYRVSPLCTLVTMRKLSRCSVTYLTSTFPGLTTERVLCIAEGVETIEPAERRGTPETCMRWGLRQAITLRVGAAGRPACRVFAQVIVKVFTQQNEPETHHA